MPIEPRLISGVVRQVEVASGRIAVNSRTGKAVDGGGWRPNASGWAKAVRQAGYVNDAWRSKYGGVGTARRSASPTRGPTTASPM